MKKFTRKILITHWGNCRCILDSHTKNLDQKTAEEKLHINSVTTQTNEHKNRKDMDYYIAIKMSLNLSTSFSGKRQSFYLFEDDKSYVSSGITEYRNSLPNHDWANAKAHKIISPAHAGLRINDNYMDFEFNGACPTDLDKIVRSENFDLFYKISRGLMKSVFVISLYNNLNIS